MKIVDVVSFASTALRGHRLRTILSLVGVSIGVTAVVLLTSLGEGARLYVTGEFASLGSNLLIVTPGRTETTGFVPVGGAPHDLTYDDMDSLRRVPGVRRVAGMAMGSAVARAGDRTRETIVIGATSEWADVRRIVISRGSFLPASEAAGDRSLCVIGSTVERDLFGGRSALGALLRLGDERFRIVGVVAPRGTSLGMDLDQIVIIPAVRHMKMFNETSLARVLVEMRSHDEIEEGRGRVIAALTARHSGDYDVTVMTQDSILATFSRLLGVLTAALTGIAAISLTVAGVGIMNVMLVSVSERTREIGLLKALGATSSQVLRLFLTEAATLSLTGGAVGLAAALVATAFARQLFPSFPMQAPAWAMPAAAVISLSVGLLFGTLPARRAARLDPIVALSRR